MGVQKEITISGVGGQGMMVCGTLLAEAAVLFDKGNATFSSEYGTEARGTFAKADVIVSEEEIYFPDVTEPDLIICLHQKAYVRYSGKTENHALIIYDPQEVQPDPAQAEYEKSVEISRIAREELGNPACANIVTMGLIAGLTDCVSVDAGKKAIERFFGKKGEKVLNLNYKAFDRGYEIGKGMK